MHREPRRTRTKEDLQYDKDPYIYPGIKTKSISSIGRRSKRLKE